MRKAVLSVVAVVVVMSAVGGVLAQAEGGQDRRTVVGVAEVKVAGAVERAVREQGGAKKISLDRTVAALSEELIVRLQGTRKFRVVARSDLDALFKEQDFTLSGSVYEDAQAAKVGQIRGLEYLLVVSVVDFQDYLEEATFEGTGEKARKRVIRVGAVGKLYNTSTGDLVESVSVQIGPGDPDYRRLRDISEVRTYAKAEGDLSDRLLMRAGEVLAERIVNRIVDVLFPARILSRMGNQVTINRGDGTNITVGQVWNVYAQGRELVDPDTGLSLGREEIQVGSVRITEVGPMVSKAEVVEDRGIEAMQVLRPAGAGQ